MRRALSWLLILSGAISFVVGTFWVEPSERFGLPLEAVAETQDYVQSLPALEIVGGDSDLENQKKRVVLDGLWAKANGGEFPWHGPQEAGDCGAQSFAGAIELDLAVQIDAGEPLEWRPVNRHWLYSGGRWQGSRKVVGGEGSVPSLIARHVEQHGVLWQTDDGAPAYTGRSVEEWGNRPPPYDRFPHTRDYPVTGIRAVRSAQDVCNAICAGYLVPFGSMRWGTDSIQLVEGRNVARDTKNWPHAQFVSGYDGTLASGQRLFRVLNSWGPHQHKPHSRMPGDRPGGYYITWEAMESICKENMAFVVCGTQGPRQRDFNPDWSVIGSATPLMPMESDEMDSTWLANVSGLQLIGFTLMLLGIGLLLLGKRRGGGRLAIVTALAVSLASTPSARAEEVAATWDFSSLAIPGSTPPSLGSANFATLTEDSPDVDFGCLATNAVAAEPESLGTCDFSVLAMTVSAPPPAAKPTPPAPVIELRDLPESRHWVMPTDERSRLLDHLMGHPNHSGKWTREQLERMPVADLERLHDLDHNGVTVGGSTPTPLPQPPRQAQRPAAMVAQAPQLVNHSTPCPNGVCPTRGNVTTTTMRTGGLFQRIAERRAQRTARTNPR